MDLIVHNRVIPAANQIETHPFCQQIEPHKFLEQNNVQIESWGLFAEGKDNCSSWGDQSIRYKRCLLMRLSCP